MVQDAQADAGVEESVAKGKVLRISDKVVCCGVAVVCGFMDGVFDHFSRDIDADDGVTIANEGERAKGIAAADIKDER